MKWVNSLIPNRFNCTNTMHMLLIFGFYNQLLQRVKLSLLTHQFLKLTLIIVRINYFLH